MHQKRGVHMLIDKIKISLLIKFSRIAFWRQMLLHLCYFFATERYECHINESKILSHPFISIFTPHIYHKQTNTVMCRYNAMNFHQIFHKTHHVARPRGRDIVWSLVQFSVVIAMLYKISFNIWLRYNGTRLYSWEKSTSGSSSI